MTVRARIQHHPSNKAWLRSYLSVIILLTRVVEYRQKALENTNLRRDKQGVCVANHVERDKAVGGSCTAIYAYFGAFLVASTLARR